ncbi:hypothetical protein [Peribacillus frigoritolerans]|uniref:hypothetical protein n=1 Tax=Peribacillus frigoritolerans TaxID=450367 RepID=UPI00215A8E54|nr:hypothetical protein [Peribacillus frigoritolerans]MCR8867467.1 hypothetical protein [Peribacillus frigoritolerans]
MCEESIWSYIDFLNISEPEIKKENELVAILKILHSYGKKLPKDLSFKLNLYNMESEYFLNYDARVTFTIIDNEEQDSVGLFKVMFKFGSLFPLHLGYNSKKIHCTGLKMFQNSLEKLFSTEFKETINIFRQIKHEWHEHENNDQSLFFEIKNQTIGSHRKYALDSLKSMKLPLYPFSMNSISVEPDFIISNVSIKSGSNPKSDNLIKITYDDEVKWLLQDKFNIIDIQSVDIVWYLEQLRQEGLVSIVKKNGNHLYKKVTTAL